MCFEILTSHEKFSKWLNQAPFLTTCSCKPATGSFKAHSETAAGGCVAPGDLFMWVKFYPPKRLKEGWRRGQIWFSDMSDVRYSKHIRHVLNLSKWMFSKWQDPPIVRRCFFSGSASAFQSLSAWALHSATLPIKKFLQKNP